MKNIFKQKRNILIMMFALVVIMGIGFAAYSQQLQIKDTSSIDSNWDIYISNVTAGTKEAGTLIGGATGTGAPDPDIKTQANLTTDLKYPGDSITYTIDVTNGGTVDAEVEKVELKPTKKNTVIKYSIIDEANIQYLNAGDTKQFKVKVEYDPEKTGTVTDDEKSNSLTLTIDYVQKGTGSGNYVPSQKAADMLISKATDTGDGLYADEYEESRYIYKGASPDNYITFNDESWRIISVENDNSIKIMKNESIENREWDNNRTGVGFSNAWPNSSLSNYLNNDYYNGLTLSAKKLIDLHKWYFGYTGYNVSLENMLINEKTKYVEKNIGIISITDFILANSNKEQCGSYNLHNSNTVCSKTNYITTLITDSWTLSRPEDSSSVPVFYVSSNGNIIDERANAKETLNVLPVLYLSSNISLEGEGTESNPYTIVS